MVSYFISNKKLQSPSPLKKKKSSSQFSDSDSNNSSYQKGRIIKQGKEIETVSNTIRTNEQQHDKNTKQSTQNLQSSEINVRKKLRKLQPMHGSVTFNQKQLDMVNQNSDGLFQLQQCGQLNGQTLKRVARQSRVQALIAKYKLGDYPMEELTLINNQQRSLSQDIRCENPDLLVLQADYQDQEAKLSKYYKRQRALNIKRQSELRTQGNNEKKLQIQNLQTLQPPKIDILAKFEKFSNQRQKIVMQKLIGQYNITDQWQERMKFQNQRQMNIIFNSLSFIDDVVKNPKQSVRNVVDLGYECRQMPGAMEKSDYQSLFEVNDGSILSQLQLETRHAVFEIEKLKKRFKTVNSKNRKLQPIN